MKLSTPYLLLLVATTSFFFLPGVTALVNRCPGSTSSYCMPNGINAQDPATFQQLINTYAGNKVFVPLTWTRVNIAIQYCRSCAGFTNELNVVTPPPTSYNFIFNNQNYADLVVPKQCVAPLSDGEVEFVIYVRNTNSYFFTGPANRSSGGDSRPHAIVVPQADVGDCKAFYVGFEDYIGGDYNYGDFNFYMTICNSDPLTIQCNPTMVQIPINSILSTSTVVASVSNQCGGNPSVSLSQTSFASPGTYTVTATATDALGQSSTCMSQVLVYDPPSAAPSSSPSASPTTSPSASPTSSPSASPTSSPSASPTSSPSASPTSSPSASPTSSPSASPFSAPSASPLSPPSASPSAKPSSAPSNKPSSAPSLRPSSYFYGNGTFDGPFMLVQAGLSKTSPTRNLGIYSNGATINVTKFGKIDISLVALNTCCFSMVNFTFQGKVTRQYVVPYSLGGNSGGKFNPVSGLKTVGTKSIFVKGISSKNTVVASTWYNFTVVK